ncbi:hypothetical protein W909_07280 [Dickeya zeae EC1]|nr:hypothetical protein W909_07280 [Dickeya zeae EC1]
MKNWIKSNNLLNHFLPAVNGSKDKAIFQNIYVMVRKVKMPELSF